MLFEEYEDDIEVWRNIKPTGWADASWTLVDTIKGRFEAIQGTETMINDQSFSDAMDMLLCDYEYQSRVRVGDGLRIVGDTVERYATGEPEEWKWELIHPHLAIKCQRRQWSLT
jgi:hypothetical protein